VKRLFDIALGTVLALLVLPVVFLLAIAVAISMRAWPFFVQTRVGKDGSRFRFPKLRTLPPHAPQYATKYEIAHFHRSGLAAFLRKSHLDELPQLFLVPIGRLSLVGPRPEMPHLHAHLGEFGDARTSVRPGCVGLWQVSCGTSRLIGESPEYDLFYLRHWSIRLDCWILFRYVAMLSGLRPQVVLDDVPPWALGEGLVPESALDGVDLSIAEMLIVGRPASDTTLGTLSPAGG
jgi:lipopolysaccharide/colanic/teichoic acid biosynthesis glycosyltransferase